MNFRRSILVALGLCVLFACAYALRAGTEVWVIADDGVHFTVPGDPYYHMRRIAFSAARFPETLPFDRYVNFPEGAAIVWPPAFDWSLAAVARAWVGPDDPVGVEHVAARAPAVLGALAVVIVALVARRRFSPGAGWLAGIFLALLPAHLLHSQVGQLDHHVAVATAAAGLIGMALACVAGPKPPSLLSGVALGAGFAVMLLLWPGALIHVGLLDGMLVLQALLAQAAAEARRRAGWLAAVNATAFAAIAPFGLGREWSEFGPWSPWVLSNFQPVFFAAAALALLGAALVWRIPAVGDGPARRVGAAVAIGAAGLGGALLAIPGLLDVLDVAAGWFSKQEAFQQEVAELQPFHPSVAASRLTLLVFAFPLVWAALAWKSLRERASADRFVLLGMAAAFFGLAALQRRFGNSFSVFYVLVYGWAFAVAVPAARAGFRRMGWLRRSLSIALAGLLGLLVLDSLLAFHVPRQDTLSRARREPVVAARGPLGVRHRLFDAGARWLATASPPTQGWLDPQVAPAYAVLCSWDAGHMVRYRAQRPLVQDNFGVYGGRENYEAAGRYYEARDEAVAVAILRDMGVRYVLADRQGTGRAEPYAADTMTYRLAHAFGSALDATAGRPETPALRHHRLIWHQRSQGERTMAAEPPGFALGIWERVEGARVVGFAAPGERVEARLRLETSQGRVHRLRSVARSDAAGRYELILPYPTDVRFSDAVEAVGPWQIDGESRGARLELPEAAVQAGSEVAGPDLRGVADQAERRIGG